MIKKDREGRKWEEEGEIWKETWGCEVFSSKKWCFCFHLLQSLCSNDILSALTQISYIYNQGEISNGELIKTATLRLPPIIRTNSSTQKVEIKVSDPQADSAKGFYTYLISGSDDLGSFEIRRRYNDFFYLRESLVKVWPALYIPPIPEKKIAVPL